MKIWSYSSLIPLFDSCVFSQIYTILWKFHLRQVWHSSDKDIKSYNLSTCRKTHNLDIGCVSCIRGSGAYCLRWFPHPILFVNSQVDKYRHAVEWLAAYCNGERYIIFWLRLLNQVRDITLPLYILSVYTDAWSDIIPRVYRVRI